MHPMRNVERATTIAQWRYERVILAPDRHVMLAREQLTSVVRSAFDEARESLAKAATPAEFNRFVR